MRTLPFIVTLLTTPVSKAWHPLNYAFDPRIHNFGNHGLLGKIHAKLAPSFTKMIDNTVYGSVDIREKIIKREGRDKQILDIGCGTGFSTSDIFGSVGIDASQEMVHEAMKQFPGKTFEVGYAEYYEPKKDFDIVTCMFLMHEAPSFARKKIINNAINIAKEKVIIVDIAPEYVPSKLMKSGEPYIDEYLANIRSDLSDFCEEVIVPGHVHAWFYKESEPTVSKMKVKRRKAMFKKYKNYNTAMPKKYRNYIKVIPKKHRNYNKAKANGRHAKINKAKKRDANHEIRYYS